MHTKEEQSKQRAEQPEDQAPTQQRTKDEELRQQERE